MRCEPVALSKSDWPGWTVENEHCLSSATDDMYVRWSMIIGINRYAQAIESQDGWHIPTLAEPNRLGKLWTVPF
jgi:hypothetical protein